MQKYKHTIRTVVMYGLSLFLVVGYPLTALADSADTSAATPAVTEQTAAPKSGATYNTDTQHWDTSKWHYNPVTKHYEAVVAPAPTPAAVTAPEATSQSSGPGSTNTTAGTSTATTNTAATTNSSMSNDISSKAQTGNAAVTGNTSAGSATTGNASAAATVTNTVNSSVSGGAAAPATFVSNITGDVYGDIMLYPMMLAAMLQQGNTTNANTTTAINTNQIANDVTLHAASGDATVAGNTHAGDATTGSANAVASVMNIVNSIIAANQSFVGTINIYGNLNGDILVAPDFIPQLLASNNTTSTAANNTTTVAANDTTGIVNNVNLHAASGAATVAGNTSAGNATTGNATTNTVILNLTGHQIVASNSMLVFVNVLGTWVGMIVDAPTGATAAALGDGVTTNTTNADQTVTANTTTNIVNNINLDAQTGNATVSHNTAAGNATTGNATASAAILNIGNSTLGLSNWFGVLFINVFGSWDGSFGVDTASGNAPKTAEPDQNSATPSSTAGTPSQAIQFIAKTAGSGHATNFSSLLADSAITGDSPAVLGTATTTLSPKATAPKVSAPKAQNANPVSTAAIMVLAGLGLAGIGWILVATRRS